MLLRLSIVIFVAALATAEIPSYIKICGRRNPKLGKCLKHGMMGLRDKLKEGIPELQVPPLEPLSLEGFPIYNETQVRADATNAKFSGFTNFKTKDLQIDLEAKQIYIEVYFEKLTIDADLDFEANIFMPMQGKGPISITTNDITAKVLMNYKLLMNRNGGVYMFFHKMMTKLTVNDFTTDLTRVKDDRDGSDIQFTLNLFMKANRETMLASITPKLEEKISKKMLYLTNKICKHFTYDELFPDRE